MGKRKKKSVEFDSSALLWERMENGTATRDDLTAFFMFERDERLVKKAVIHLMGTVGLSPFRMLAATLVSQQPTDKKPVSKHIQKGKNVSTTSNS